MKKVLLFLLVLLLPIFVNAESLVEVNNINSKISFRIDNDIWKETAVSDADNAFVERKWISECGEITSGAVDVYDTIYATMLASSDEKTQKEFETLSKDEIRKLLYYENLFNSEFLNGFSKSDLVMSENMNIANIEYSYRNNVKLIHVNGQAKNDKSQAGMDMYTTINNGYYYIIQYNYNGEGSNICYESFNNVIDTLKDDVIHNSITEEDPDTKSVIIYLVLGIITISLIYMLVPLVLVLLLKKKYSYKQANIIAIINSVVICVISLFITITSDEAWKITVALLYYFINVNILQLNKEKKEEVKENKSSRKEELKPKDVDQKYTDLRKLKELLDDRIINKEEFEKEKKKILK